MTVEEVKSEDTKVVVVEEEKTMTSQDQESTNTTQVEEKGIDVSTPPPVVVVEEEDEKPKEEESVGSSPPPIEKRSSFKEESSILSDLKEVEKKALVDLKSKLEDAILNNKIFKQEEKKETPQPIEKPKEEEEKEKIPKEEVEKEKPKEEEKPKVEEEKEKPKEEEKPNEEEEKEKIPKQEDEQLTLSEASQVGEEKEEKEQEEEKKPVVDVEISLWGVPLLPSKGAEGLDVILLKFLRAREFKVNDAFEMLVRTLEWRKQNKIDSILEEDTELDADLSTVVYMDGVDSEGHPICYNVYGVFENEELYGKIFGTEEKCRKFLRWRFQLMEKGIQKLKFTPGGVSSLLQINDLKNTPGPSKKELRVATKQAVGLLQDNYPEFVARNIFVNVPFWYYAFNALLSPFLTQRTKSKFVFARPAKVTETLLKYIPAEQIPTRYGGLKRDNDTEFCVEDGSAIELIVKAGSTETIEIDAPEVGKTLVWDLTVLGWEVNYKEEFVPTDEGSYTIIVQKTKKISSEEVSLRNSFRNNEPGKVVLTIENGSYKKKHVLYRYKTKTSS